MPINTTQEILEDIRQGQMVILMDDEDRENEGDLIIAAETVRAEHITFFAVEACGLICLTLTEERARALALPQMVQHNNSQHETNFTVSIDAAGLEQPGISSESRALTVEAAISENAGPDSIVQPGHVFPLVAKPGGVLRRAGHTEAGCDLARLAGFRPAAVIVEIVNEDGSMARRPQLEVFADKHGLKIGTIADLIAYRAMHEQTIERLHEREITTEFGPFRLVTFKDLIDDRLHFALVRGQPDMSMPVMVRVHVLNTLRDLFHATREAQSPSWSLTAALQRIAQEGEGVLVLVSRESAPELEYEQILSYPQLPERPSSGGERGEQFWRVNGTGSQILKSLGVVKMRLLSSPTRFSAISGFNLEIVEFIARDPRS